MSAGATWHDEESGWLIRAGADSQTGNYRETNLDHVWLGPDLPLALVLDGSGGPGAERAVLLAAEAIRDRARTGRANDEPPETLLGAAFRAGHDATIRWQGTDPEYRNCASTVVAAWAQNGRVYVTWLGNSRAYRVSRGSFAPLTRDHNFMNALIRAGQATEADACCNRASHYLMNFLGQWEPDFELELPSFVPLPGDRLVLTTDGVHSFLDDTTILTACQTISDPATCAEAIVEHALMAWSRDNCTCAVLAFEWAGDGPAPEPPASRKWWRFGW